MNPMQLSWLAGLLEGEGSFSSAGRGRVVLEINTTDLDVAVRVSILFGLDGKVRRREAHGIGKLPQFRVGLWDRRAIAVMMQIYPLMGVRRQQQITRAIEEWQNR